MSASLNKTFPSFVRSSTLFPRPLPVYLRHISQFESTPRWEAVRDDTFRVRYNKGVAARGDC